MKTLQVPTGCSRDAVGWCVMNGREPAAPAKGLSGGFPRMDGCGFHCFESALLRCYAAWRRPRCESPRNMTGGSNSIPVKRNEPDSLHIGYDVTAPATRGQARQGTGLYTIAGFVCTARCSKRPAPGPFRFVVRHRMNAGVSEARANGMRRSRRCRSLTPPCNDPVRLH